MNKLIFLITILVFLLGKDNPKAQVISHYRSSRGHSEKPFIPQDTIRISSNVTPIFYTIQDGILLSDIETFSKLFDKQVYVDLKGIESGYYSGNQAFYILKNFFSARRTVNFKFSTIREMEETPYATGGGTFIMRGNRETLQIYVALTKRDKRWVITQFSVY